MKKNLNPANSKTSPMNGVATKTIKKTKNEEQKTKEKLRKALSSSTNKIKISPPPTFPTSKLKPAEPKPAEVPKAKTSKENGKNAQKVNPNYSKPSTSKSSTKSSEKKVTKPTKRNGFVEVKNEPPQSDIQSSKKRKMKPTITSSGFVEESNDAPKTKSKKVKRNASGFIETNVNDEKKNKLVNQILQEHRHQFLESMGVDPTIPKEKFQAKEERTSSKSIPVHAIPCNKSQSATSGSDSEDNSYIDKFFKNKDEARKEKNSKNALSVPKAEKLAEHNGDHSSNSETNESNASSDNGSVLSGDEQQLVQYNGGDGGSDTSSGSEADSDLYDFGNYFDEMDGEYISDGDEYSIDNSTGSDDEDEEFDGEEGDEEIEEEESDCSNLYDYDDDEDDLWSHSDDDDEFDEDSSNSEDDDDNDSTYDEFLHGRNGKHSDDDTDDTDYDDEQYDDLVIVQGTAVTYKFTDSRIKLFENDTEARIIDLPKSDSEDEECVQLVPMSTTRKEIIAKEKLKKQTKKMHERVVAMKAKQREAEHQAKCESYFRTGVTQAPCEDKPVDTKPVIITCLSGSLDELPLDVDLTDESASDMEEDSIDLKTTSFPSRCISSVAINKSSNMEVEHFEPQNSSESVDVPINESAPLSPSQSPSSSPPPVCTESERIINRNINASKSQMAKLKPIFINSINSQHVLVLLRNIIYFHGNLQIKLIAGNAQVFGYELERNKSVTVHSTRGHSLIYLLPTPSEQRPSNHITSFDSLNELRNDFLTQDIDTLIAEFNANADAILLLERDRQHKGVNMIDRYMRETMFPNINAFNNDSPFYSSEFILHCQFSFRPRNGLLIADWWSSVRLENTTKLVTIGGKGVGKSTFVRYTINSNLSKFKKFVFIDLDIGQPELFVPQTISATLVTTPILGPGYLENIAPTKAIFFGEINVLLHPIKYLRCVMQLYEFCANCEAFQGVPWVINTMGYSRGLGTELMACILRVFQPNRVVQIQSDVAAENFDAIIDSFVVNQFKYNIFKAEMIDVPAVGDYYMHIFDAITSNDANGKAKQTDMTSKDIRYAMILAKLGNCLRSNSDWLTSIRPFETSLTGLNIIVANNEQIDEASVPDVLNANLVYLCEIRTENPDNIADCHGIGIVRAIDIATDKLYLLSSIPVDELAKVNALAIGAMPLPSAVLLNQHRQVHGTVPFVYNSDDFIGSKQVVSHVYRSEKNRKNNPIELMQH